MSLKYQSIVRQVVVVVFASVIVVSCNQNSETKTLKKSEEKAVTEEPKKEEVLNLNIEDYFPGPNYMRYIVLDDNKLNLTDAQKNGFELWRTENQPQIQLKMQEIHAINKEIKMLSKQKAPLENIQLKVDVANELRKEIAEIKMQCRDQLIENLDDKQWTVLVENYATEFPYKERTQMMSLMHHVNPVPNYMQVINANSADLGISDENMETFGNWSKDNHPKMMAMANQITVLEKEIYQGSLQKMDKAAILDKFTQIENLRKDIVTKKTNCRDLIIETLSPEQWTNLIEKI